MIRIFLVLIFLTPLATAQYKIGVILSQSGQSAVLGQQQSRAVAQFIRQLGAFTGNYEIILRDDGSYPQETLEQVQDLVENQGVVALVCCTLNTNLQTISDYLSSQSIVTISPSDLTTPSPWIFSTKPTLQRLLQSIILQLSSRDQQTIGVMTPENSLGLEVEAALNLLLSPGGMRLGVLQTYPVDVTVLTPEALWVATRLPESVVVWGTPKDSVLAYKALRERGFEREVILNTAGINLHEVEGASFVLSPVQVASSLPNTHPSFQSSFSFSSEIDDGTMDSAYVYDALGLLKAALEQVFTFGIPNDDISALRFALRDALIGLGPYAGVAAVYDYNDSDPIGIDPFSLVIGKASQGKLVFVP